MPRHVCSIWKFFYCPLLFSVREIGSSAFFSCNFFCRFVPIWHFARRRRHFFDTAPQKETFKNPGNCAGKKKLNGDFFAKKWRERERWAFRFFQTPTPTLMVQELLVSKIPFPPPFFFFSTGEGSITLLAEKKKSSNESSSAIFFLPFLLSLFSPWPVSIKLSN